MLTKTSVNSLEAKGVGEAVTFGSTPAVAIAVIDAPAPFGIKHVDLRPRTENCGGD